jgi:hypothetical protein
LDPGILELGLFGFQYPGIPNFPVFLSSICISTFVVEFFLFFFHVRPGAKPSKSAWDSEDIPGIWRLRKGN